MKKGAIKKKIIAKKPIKIKKGVSIYNQLEILAPEEIKYLNTTLCDTIDFAVRLVEEQKHTLDQLNRIKNGTTMNPYYNPEDTDKNIEIYTESLEVNLKKIKTMKGITNKLKAFEGII